MKQSVASNVKCSCVILPSYSSLSPNNCERVIAFLSGRPVPREYINMLSVVLFVKVWKDALFKHKACMC